MEQTDWHEQEEQRFLAKLAARLDKAVLAGETQSLIVVAPPRAIGVLRRQYSAHIRQALKAEVEKDYVRMPVADIARHLSSVRDALHGAVAEFAQRFRDGLGQRRVRNFADRGLELVAGNGVRHPPEIFQLGRSRGPSPAIVRTS